MLWQQSVLEAVMWTGCLDDGSEVAQMQLGIQNWAIVCWCQWYKMAGLMKT